MQTQDRNEFGIVDQQQGVTPTKHVYLHHVCVRSQPLCHANNRGWQWQLSTAHNHQCHPGRHYQRYLALNKRHYALIV